VNFVWYPPDAENFTKTIVMYYNETEPISYDSFWDTISFTGVMTSPGFPQLGNISIVYSDSNSSTTDTQIYLYESYNGSIVNLSWNSRIGENSFSILNGSINTTRLHYAVLYFNNTASFDITSPVTISIYPLYQWTSDVPFDFDDRIRNIIGPPPKTSHGIEIATYANIVAIVVPLIVLMSLGPYNTGAGITGCGMSLGFMQGIYAMRFTSAFNPVLAGVGVLAVIIGIVYWMSKGSGGDKL
jgi:hypothetical protein